jgi:adenylate/nucleoside-diphosphate kinase
MILFLPATDLINQHILLMTETGVKCQEILVRGEAIPEDMVIRMIEDKIHSPEVTHHGMIYGI